MVVYPICVRCGVELKVIKNDICIGRVIDGVLKTSTYMTGDLLQCPKCYCIVLNKVGLEHPTENILKMWLYDYDTPSVIPAIFLVESESTNPMVCCRNAMENTAHNVLLVQLRNDKPNEAYKGEMYTCPVCKKRILSRITEPITSSEYPTFEKDIEKLLKDNPQNVVIFRRH
jgi:hypothetical protein